MAISLRLSSKPQSPLNAHIRFRIDHSPKPDWFQLGSDLVPIVPRKLKLILAESVLRKTMVSSLFPICFRACLEINIEVPSLRHTLLQCLSQYGTSMLDLPPREKHRCASFEFLRWCARWRHRQIKSSISPRSDSDWGEISL